MDDKAKFLLPTQSAASLNSFLLKQNGRLADTLLGPGLLDDAWASSTALSYSPLQDG
jgi:hypothetical protein